MKWKRKKSIIQLFLKDVTYILGEKLGNSEIQLTLDNLNTQKIELHTNPC